MNRETIITALNSLNDDKLSNGDDVEIWKAIMVIVTALRFLLKEVRDD